MIVAGVVCPYIANHLLRAERAIDEEKRTLIYDYTDHLLGSSTSGDLAKIKALTKLL